MTDLIIEDKQLYMLADREFYEPISRYVPQLADYHQPLSRILPEAWALRRYGLWWDCSRQDAEVPAQGWKIHLSATPAHSPAILMTAARILFEHGVPFKFVADRMLLMMVNNKRWSRGSAGKFITAYPRDDAQCGALLEELHAATIGYWGPYILSDRRFRSSRIVHYRYGGLLSSRRMDESGRAIYVIKNGRGEYVDDERTPYFKLPEGISDPFAEPDAVAVDGGEPGTLKKGRYEIRSVLVYSNSGGVYLALDRQTSRQVVIKEGRPYTNVSSRGLDAVQLLKKEHRLLQVLEDTGVAPKPLDFFIDWEHAYLVEEYLDDCVTLRTYAARINLLLRTRAGIEDSRIYFEKFRSIFADIAKTVRVLHSRKIIFSDLSVANIMISEGDDDAVGVKLIDFEGAYEEDVDVPTHLFTPGFSPASADERGWSTKEDDYYALGGLMLAGLFPINSILTLNRVAHESYLDAIEADFGLPATIATLIRDLLSGQPARYPPIDRIIEVLTEPHEPVAPRIGTREFDALDPRNALEAILGYARSVADFDRTDRLFPADSAVYSTNPLSIAHGACGVAFVMHRVNGHVAPEVIEWIRSQPMDSATYATGLYSGLSGIAWSMLEMGMEQEAFDVLSKCDGHHLLFRSANLFNGAAGWGMTQLRFFLHTGDRVHLDAAITAGRHLVASRQVDESVDGSYWATGDGISASLGHGAAGIALFLLYLHLSSGDDEFLETGLSAMRWVSSKSSGNPDGALTWIARENTPSQTPYWRWGSSGIGRVALRYWAATGDPRFADMIERIHIDCDRKYTIFPGYFFGVSGIADMYLDMARFERWSEVSSMTVRKLLSGCMLFAMRREGGIAFPGESLNRISCDFGTGGAGIALVIHRHMTRCGASFMLDELIPGWRPQDRAD